ncbi:MAG: hypothetical protein HFI90_01150 [Clostridia bacterium]|nr:hypothetical protein [Clostridia bacterium]
MYDRYNGNPIDMEASQVEGSRWAVWTADETVKLYSTYDDNVILLQSI